MQVGQIVTILPRSHPGINRCGGTAFITRIHTDSNDENNPGGKPIKIDVKYVLGGKESGIELTYVREDVSSMSATTAATATSTRMTRDKRERKQDVKMNVGEWGGGGGGQKKRVALGDVDGNCGSRKRGKNEVEKKKKKNNASMTNAELSGVNEEHGGLPEGSEMDGEWMFIKSGKISSYLSYLTATTRIQYWWNHEDGWLHATILKSIQKVVTSKIIKWVVKVEFEDGEKASLTFHPGDKRWKVHIGPADKKNETKEDDQDGGKCGRKRDEMASEKKIQKSPANPPSKRKNAEKKIGKKSSAKACSGGSEPVESNAQASGGADDCHAVEMSKPTDLGLLVKNDNTKSSGSSTTVNMSKPTDLGLLVKKDSARASGSGRTMNTKKPSLLVKNDSAGASSSGIVNKDEPTDLDFLIKNDKARACSSGGTITMSKRTDVGLLVKKNRGGACSTGAGTVAMSKPNDFGLLTKNDSTKASNTDGPAKKSKPVSVTLDARGTVFKKETNRDTPASTTQTKQTDNKNTTPFAKKKEIVPTIDNAYKSDKSTRNTVTPFHRATQKKASASNRAASFSFPSNTQSKLKEVASKMTKETEESNASSLAQRIDGLEAARVLAASKKKSSRPRSYVDLTAEPTGEKKSEAKTTQKEASANSSRPMTLTETLYEKESNKAEEFVNHMMRRDEGNNVAEAKKPSASSPGGSVSSSSASGELVVKVDDQRKELFKAGVYQVMTRLHVEKMDVEELITKVNAYSSSQNQEPFTPLEARAYLRHLDSQNNVFMVWDEGKSGVVYPF